MSNHSVLYREEAINKAIEKGENLWTLYQYAGKNFTPEQIDKAIDKGEELDYLYYFYIDCVLSGCRYSARMYGKCGTSFSTVTSEDKSRIELGEHETVIGSSSSNYFWKR